MALNVRERAGTLLVAGLLIGCAQTPREAPAAVLPHGSVSWACDFEGSYCGMDEQSKIEPAHRSSFVSTARSGKQAIKLTTLPGDARVHSSGDWERDDLALAASPDYCNEGQDEWWAVSMLFPDDYVVPRQGGVVLDFHGTASTGQPTFNVMSQPTGLRLHGFYGDMKNPQEYRVELGRVKRNVWYDFVYHVRWSSKDDGFMVAWLNGKKVLVHRGPTLYAGISCYLKLANYHDGSGSPSSIIFDHVVRGTGPGAVALGRLGN